MRVKRFSCLLAIWSSYFVNYLYQLFVHFSSGFSLLLFETQICEYSQSTHGWVVFLRFQPKSLSFCQLTGVIKEIFQKYFFMQHFVFYREVGPHNLACHFCKRKTCEFCKTDFELILTSTFIPNFQAFWKFCHIKQVAAQLSPLGTEQAPECPIPYKVMLLLSLFLPSPQHYCAVIEKKYHISCLYSFMSFKTNAIILNFTGLQRELK